MGATIANCTYCDTEMTLTQTQKGNYKRIRRTYCSDACRQAWVSRYWAERPKKTVTANCTGCGMQVQIADKRKRDSYNSSGRAYCGETCQKNWLKRRKAEVLADYNRQHASARMKANNPMQREESRQKMSATLKSIGHRPPIIMGNGSLTVPQMALAKALGRGWEMELPVRTGQKRGSGYPHCYKVDIGNAGLKIAIEADGPSHSALQRKAGDAKRDALLRGLGWTVLRFTNKQINENLPACVQTVRFTILKLKERTPTSPTAQLSTTAIAA